MYVWTKKAVAAVAEPTGTIAQAQSYHLLSYCQLAYHIIIA